MSLAFHILQLVKFLCPEIRFCDFHYPLWAEPSCICQKGSTPRPLHLDCYERLQSYSMSPLSKCSFCLLPEHTNGNGDYTSSLLGILVMQDVHLGLLVALLPAIAGRKGMAPSKGNTGVVHNILNGLEKESDSGNLGFLIVIAKLFLPITGLEKSPVQLLGTSRFHCMASNY